MRAREGQNVDGGDIALQQGAAGGTQAGMRWVAGRCMACNQRGRGGKAPVPSRAAA